MTLCRIMFQFIFCSTESTLPTRTHKHTHADLTWHWCFQPAFKSLCYAKWMLGVCPSTADILPGYLHRVFYSFIPTWHRLPDRPNQSFILMEYQTNILQLFHSLAVNTLCDLQSVWILIFVRLRSCCQMWNISSCLLKPLTCCIQTYISFIRALWIKHDKS